MAKEKTLSLDDELVCPKCGKDWDNISDNWNRTEECLCGEFLDNPPCLIKKKAFDYSEVNQTDK